MKCGREYAARKRGGGDLRRPAAALRRGHASPAGDRDCSTLRQAHRPARWPCTAYRFIRCGASSCPAWACRWRPAAPGGSRWSAARRWSTPTSAPRWSPPTAHVEQLAESGVDYIFFPAVINEHDPDLAGGAAVPARKPATTTSATTRSTSPRSWPSSPPWTLGERLLSPLVYFHRQSLEQVARDVHAELARAFPDLGLEETLEALTEARRSTSRPGAVALPGRRGAGGDGGTPQPAPAAAGRPRVVLAGPALRGLRPRPQPGAAAQAGGAGRRGLLAGGAGPGGLPAGLRPASTCSACTGITASRSSGRPSTAAATPGLYPVFLTCFRCSPDAFLISYVKDIMDALRQALPGAAAGRARLGRGLHHAHRGGLRTFASHRRARGRHW